MKSFDYSTFLSPFTWRYGSSEMRTIWSEENKRRLWRKVWVALAKAQYKEGLVSKKELDDLIKHQNDIDIEKAHEIEKEIHHDLMAEIKTFAIQSPIGGGKIHLGATSMDIEDNADTIRYKESLALLEQKLKELLKEFSIKIERHKDTVCMAYTHLQPAEPTTLGYRFSIYAQDLLFDLKFLQFFKTLLKGKGMKGAVGTSASYTALLNEHKAELLNNTVMKELELEDVLIASQVAPRKIESLLGKLLSSIAETLYKFAFDVRIQQSPGFGEWQEPFGKKQVGSSAMPFKRNPWKCEQLCSLGRLVFHLSDVLRDNASHMLLERTLDDSPSRRAAIPELFLSLDEMLSTAVKVINGMVINKQQIEYNLQKYGPFSATESILMNTVKKGADRQEMHEVLRDNSLKAWEEIQNGRENPLSELLMHDKRITKFLSSVEIKKLLDPKNHVGLAAKKSSQLVKKIADELSN